MGKLEDLNRGLYQPDFERRAAPSPIPGRKIPQPEANPAWREEPRPNPPLPASPVSKRHYGLIAAAIFILGAALAVGTFYFGFKKQDLVLTIHAKEQIESGEKVSYEVSYKNQGSKTLRELELSFSYPEGAEPLREEGREGKQARTRIQLEDLAPGNEARVQLEARLFGKTGDTPRAEALISYRPDESSSTFTVRSTAATSIVRVPLAVTVAVPADPIAGQEVTVSVDYALSGESSFPNISLGLEYPPGFAFLDADPPSKDGDRWDLGTVLPGDSGKITIRGRLQGTPGELKSFQATIGRYDAGTRLWAPYQTAEAAAKISTPLLSIQQFINESREAVISPGDEVHVRLHFRNTLDIPLKSISVEAAVSGALIDLKSLTVEDGAYNGETGTIFWTPASLPDFALLPAHAEGDLRFRFRLLKATTEVNLKNPAISLKAVIRSADEPRGLQGIDLSSEDLAEARISTKLTLSSRLLYHSQHLRTSGPLPPKVGAKTTYVVLWQLANSFNDLSAVEVRAALPPGISWESQVRPAGSPISYDPGTGSIIWKAGNLPAGTGITAPMPFVAFLVGVVPAPNQIGQSPSLAERIVAAGKDAFTGRDVQETGGNLTTLLQNDPATAAKDWLVVE